MTDYPFDDVLGISKSVVSKRCAKAATWLTVFMPFDHARKFLLNTLELAISETCLKDITHRIGLKLYRESEKKSRRPESIKKSTDSYKILYLQADGSMVPIKGDGEREFKEVKLGLAYTNKDIVQKTSKNGKERVQIKNKRFISTIGEGVEKFKKMFFAQAVEKGYYTAENIILLTDGASWISKMKDEYFPEAIHILDWYHVVEHLWKTAHILFGEKNVSHCEQWVAVYKDKLWEGKIDEVIALLECEAKKRKGSQTALFELRGYFFSNRNSMRYDEYRHKGYYIGSGAIESANKYIVANRLKSAGMRWTLSHANSMIWLRSKYFEDDWNEFWKKMNLSDYLKEHGETHLDVAA
jgi:hypothetical protein